MVSNELKQLLNGEPAYFRERAPEPLLLPRIASRIPPDGLEYVAWAAKTLSNFWMPGRWPAIADAVAQVIASRHTEIGDELLRQLCDELPRLTLALVELDEAAGQRAEFIIGSDAADRLRAGLGDSTFVLREAVSRVFDEHNPPGSADDLMVFIRDRSEFEGPELQRNLLAYFLPLAPAMHHQWMVPILINVLGTYPDWGVAAAASRVAGLLDQNAIEQIEAALECEEPWAGHVHALLADGAAASVYEEVARALPHDSRLESLLANETELASLTGFVDEVIGEWGGAPPAKMEASRGWESDDLAGDDLEEFGAEPEPPLARSGPGSASRGLESSDRGVDDGDEDTGSEDAPRTRSASRGFDLEEAVDPADDAPPASPSRSRSMPPKASRSPSPQPAVEPLPERVLQAQVFADDDGIATQLSQSFWKDTRHDVLLWIGPEKRGVIKADRTLAEPTPDAEERQKGSMEIVITLALGSDVESKTVDLPIDRTQRSDIAKFSLNVAKKYVSADVWLQHKGRVLQYFELSGPTHDDPEDSISLTFQSAVRGIPVDSSGGEFGMAVVQKGDEYVVFGPTGFPDVVSLGGSGDVVADLGQDIFKSTMRLVRKYEQSNGASWVDDQNEEALKLLRKMATRGNQFYDELKKQNVLGRFSETIQFVNLDKSDIVPIEYVYDKGYPKKGATLCEGFGDDKDWNEVFAAGQCTCSNVAGETSNTICPMGFWSLSKIIERQSGSPGKSNPVVTGLAGPSATTPPIALDRYALLAAAPNVNTEDVESIENVLADTYPNRFKYASGWDEWKAEIEKSSPKLLILLPHHGEATGEDTNFLEIRSANPDEDSKLFSGTLNERCVSKNPDEPGPIVLLLGCETAQPSLLPYSRFARDFMANRASIVVGTQSSILGRHAAEVANEFIRQLLSSAGGGESFGRIMRNVRQKMFASGYLMSLTLVSFGDADWKLENSTTGENNVPH